MSEPYFHQVQSYLESICRKLFPALAQGARISRKKYEPLDKILFVPASYSEDKERAIQSIRFGDGGSMIKSFFDVDLHDRRKIERMVRLLAMTPWKRS